MITPHTATPTSKWASPSRYGPAELDPGHLLPDAAWQAVVTGAAERLAALSRPERGMGLPDRTITARSHGGVMTGGPRLGVIHSAETPLAAGYAHSISANWFATQATTSAHVMIDPVETIRLLPDNVVAYAVGPKANGFTINVEQAGRASLTRAEWLTEPGRAQMLKVAQYMVECRDRWGIPLRWATDAQIRAAAGGSPRQGWCFHDDIRRVLGGTTHTDPKPHYAADELMATAARLGSPAPTPDPGEQDNPMRNLIVARSTDGTEVWVGDGITRRWIEDQAELDDIIWWIGQCGGRNRVETVKSFRFLGRPLAPKGVRQ